VLRQDIRLRSTRASDKHDRLVQPGPIGSVLGFRPRMPKPPTHTGTVSLPIDDCSASSQARFVLRVDSGPDAGLRLAVDATMPSRALVGTSLACSLRLTDPSISRRHAAFDIAGNRLRLTDLGSTNGTYVNGIMMMDGCLDGGEFVRMGGSQLHVQRVEEQAPQKLSPQTCFGRLLGASEEMRRLYPLCERLAGSDVPVVIEGQTGTGKEVLAESLHDMGQRAEGPFVVFDCTTVPGNLAESELFGHQKGAFTSAHTDHPGVFEQANKGTLLIDEIGDLDIQLQPKLLRAIERMEVKRVGATKVMKVDVRVLAATRRDLDREVQAGRFRDDLFFRLNVARIELPPLSRRRGDISLLARHFWHELGAQRPMPATFLEQLEAYDWPGNVRELYNAVVHHHTLGDLARFDKLGSGRDADDSAHSDLLSRVLSMNLPLAEARQQMVEEFERRYLEHVLAAHGGNVSRAAAAAGVGRRYFFAIKAKRSVAR
jgi:two-component system, NtrC family, response regulator HydG